VCRPSEYSSSAAAIDTGQNRSKIDIFTVGWKRRARFAISGELVCVITGSEPRGRGERLELPMEFCGANAGGGTDSAGEVPLGLWLPEQPAHQRSSKPYTAARAALPVLRSPSLQ
jgi:hypothetical protein